jgi:hypothetical protein
MDSTGISLVLRHVDRSDVTVRVVDGSGPVARLYDVTGLREQVPFLAPYDVRLLH